MYGLYHIIYFTIIDILKTFMSPFFILVSLIIYLQYRNVNDYPLKYTLRSILFGIIGGLIATIIFIYLQVYLIPKDYLYILIISVGLSFLDKRFICISYGGSLLILFSNMFSYPKINPYEIMIVISVLHMVESILIILNYFNPWETKYYLNNNKIVGGLVNNQFWPVPFTVFIGDIFIRPVTLLAILNYSDFTISNFPKRKTIETSIILFFYSSILFILSILSSNNYLAPIFAIIGHEFIIYINKLREDLKTPLYTEPYKGIRVLKVEKASIASRLGIRHGDIILRINKMTINDIEDLRDIMFLNKGKVTISYYNLKQGLVEKTYRGKEKTLGVETFPKVQY